MVLIRATESLKDRQRELLVLREKEAQREAEKLEQEERDSVLTGTGDLTFVTTLNGDFGMDIPQKIKYTVMLREGDKEKGKDSVLALNRFRSAVKMVSLPIKRRNAAIVIDSCLHLWGKENRTRELSMCVLRFLNNTRRIQRFWRIMRKKIKVDLEEAVKQAYVTEQRHHLGVVLAR